MENTKTLFLLDGTAYIYRAFHAIRHLSNSSGMPTNAVFGFTRMLIKFFQDKSPEHVTICFDVKGPTFRHDLFKQYKANRPPMPAELQVQIAYIKKVVNAFNLNVAELSGYEADDLIGTLARKAQSAGLNVIMVTGDKDFRQLVTERATLWDPMKDRVTDLDRIKTDFGVTPQQLIDVMGFSGDTSDNIPGVPGIGPKTALKLISAFGTMEGVYQKIEAVTSARQREKLITFKAQALLSKKLVTIDTAAPVDFDLEAARIGEPDRKALATLFGELEFAQLQKDFMPPKKAPQKKYQLVLEEAQLITLAALLRRSKRFAVDTETTSKNPMRAKLVGLSFSTLEHEAFYVPCGHDYEDAPRQLSLDTIRQYLKPVLEDKSIEKIGQNIKYDWMVLQRHGIFLAGVTFDTMLASYLIDPGKRTHNLDQIALDFLDHKTISYSEVTGKGKTSRGFASVPLNKAAPYACEDADITLLARNKLQPKLSDLKLVTLFETVEMPLVPVLMQMEQRGICVNQDKLKALSTKFGNQLDELEQKIHALAGETFNIRSSQQLGRILFEKLKLPVQKKTRKKTGYSTDMEVLSTLSSKHELPALVLRQRTLAKLKSTYSDALIDLIHPETKRIHTSFNQTVTATGRLSSSNPNLQNIPIRTVEGREIRKTFIPQKGWSLISADYSQIELRILAHYSGDEILIKAFKQDEDIHLRTATEVFQTFPEFIDDDLRRQAKVINFGIIYGMSPFGLSRALNISRKMASTYIKNYFLRYKGVKQYMDQAIQETRLSGQTSTLLGRIRLLPEIKSKNAAVRSFAERTAINTPIQGTAADLIKLAMINVNRALEKAQLQTAMLLSVHDEIVVEAPLDEVAPVEALLKHEMESIWHLKVPLKVNIASGENWEKAH